MENRNYQGSLHIVHQPFFDSTAMMTGKRICCEPYIYGLQRGEEDKYKSMMDCLEMQRFCLMKEHEQFLMDIPRVPLGKKCFEEIVVHFGGPAWTARANQLRRLRKCNSMDLDSVFSHYNFKGRLQNLEVLTTSTPADGPWERHLDSNRWLNERTGGGAEVAKQLQFKLVDGCVLTELAGRISNYFWQQGGGFVKQFKKQGKRNKITSEYAFNFLKSRVGFQLPHQQHQTSWPHVTFFMYSARKLFHHADKMNACSELQKWYVPYEEGEEVDIEGDRIIRDVVFDLFIDCLNMIFEGNDCDDLSRYFAKVWHVDLDSLCMINVDDLTPKQIQKEVMKCLAEKLRFTRPRFVFA